MMKHGYHRMKHALRMVAILLLITLGAYARTWTSADGKSSFEGELIAYKAATGEVTVDRGGKRITFKQEKLSAADIAFLKSKNDQPSRRLSIF